MPRFSLVTLPALLMAGCLATLYAHADDDRFTLRLGAIRIDGEADVNAGVSLLGDSYSWSSGRLDFGTRTVPRIEGAFHLSDRNRLLFNYFRYDNGNRQVLPHDLGASGIKLPAGTTAGAKARFDLASLVYDYAFAETPSLSFGVQIGAAWAGLKGSISAVNRSSRVGISENINGAAPVVGLRLSTMTEDHRWGFTAQAQHVTTRWGSSDPYGGDIRRTNALVEYRLTRNFGIYAGYDWFCLKANRTRKNDAIGMELRFMGPTTGITLAF